MGTTTKPLKQVLFYDGVCGLCQRSVSLLAHLDKKKVLFFAPLNGQTYQALLPGKAASIQTVVFYRDGECYEKSDAIIKVFIVLGGLKKSMAIFRIIPRFFRDALYDFIAGHRNKVSCTILAKDQRFLK